MDDQPTEAPTEISILMKQGSIVELKANAWGFDRVPGFFVINVDDGEIMAVNCDSIESLVIGARP